MRAPPGSTVRSQAYDSSSFGFISFGWREDADTPPYDQSGIFANPSAVGWCPLRTRGAHYIFTRPAVSSTVVECHRVRVDVVQY